jgi:hypothetical protein
MFSAPQAVKHKPCYSQGVAFLNVESHCVIVNIAEISDYIHDSKTNYRHVSRGFSFPLFFQLSKICNGRLINKHCRLQPNYFWGISFNGPYTVVIKVNRKMLISLPTTFIRQRPSREANSMLR